MSIVLPSEALRFFFFQLDNTKQLLAIFVLYIYILVAIAVAYPWKLLCMQKSKYAKFDGICKRNSHHFRVDSEGDTNPQPT